MPINGMNVGTDYSVAYYDGGSGTLIDLGDVQQVKITALKTNISTKPYNAPARYGYVYNGYKIDFTMTRSAEDLETYFVNLEAQQYTGNVMSPGVFNETVNNPDGTVSIFQYTNFVVFMEDHGNIERDKVVTLKMEGMASQKIRLQ